jgi:hypothetical protein
MPPKGSLCQSSTCVAATVKFFYTEERMKKKTSRIANIGFIVWHAKHELIHVLLGLMWAWMLREMWGEFRMIWVLVAALGSLLPDVDHLLYFFTYGRRDPYTQTVITFFKNKQWRVLITFIEKGHKHNTSLAFHNYYVTVLLAIGCWISLISEWRFTAVLLGAMVSHFVFDIAEDILLLHHVNPNWKRWGRPLAQKRHMRDY